MNVEQEHSRSLWMDVVCPEFPPLSEATDGAVLNGPAKPLAAVADPEADEPRRATDVQPGERAARP